MDLHFHYSAGSGPTLVPVLSRFEYYPPIYT